MVECFVRDEEAAGSNPVTPIPRIRLMGVAVRS